MVVLDAVMASINGGKARGSVSFHLLYLYRWAEDRTASVNEHFFTCEVQYSISIALDVSLRMFAAAQHLMRLLARPRCHWRQEQLQCDFGCTISV